MGLGFGVIGFMCLVCKVYVVGFWAYGFGGSVFWFRVGSMD